MNENQENAVQRRQFQVIEREFVRCSPEQLLRHEFRALQPPRKQRTESASSEPEESTGREGEVSWSPPNGFGYQRIYDYALKALYYTLNAYGEWRPRGGRKAGGKPIRVFRATSFVTHGGVAKVCLQSVLHTPRDRVHYTLMAMREKNVTTHTLEERKDIEFISRKFHLWSGAYSPRYFRHVWKLARLIRKSGADLIHVHEPHFAPALRIAGAIAGGIPVIVHLHNDYTQRRTVIPRAQCKVHMDAIRNSHLIACSQTIHDAAYGWLGETRWPVELIMDGADDQPDQPPDPELADRLRRAAGGRTVLAMMSHLVPHKRIEDFLTAGRILADQGYSVFILLMAYGKIGAAQRMRDIFDQLVPPEMGEFLYQVAAPQHLMDQIGIGISTSSLEGLGLNVLEYQVAGVPVACSDLIPHREMVEDGETGLLFPVGDVAACVREVRKLLDDPAKRSRIGEAGRVSALKRKWAETGVKNAEFYEKVLGR